MRMSRAQNIPSSPNHSTPESRKLLISSPWGHRRSDGEVAGIAMTHTRSRRETCHFVAKPRNVLKTLELKRRARGYRSRGR